MTYIPGAGVKVWQPTPPRKSKLFFVLLHSSVQQKQQSRICIEGHLPQITIESDLQFVLLLIQEEMKFIMPCTKMEKRSSLTDIYTLMIC